MAWLGVAATAVAYMSFVAGLGRVTAATAGTLSLAEPLVATALAIVVLGERLSAPVAAGSLLLLGGLFVVSVPAKARRREERLGMMAGTRLAQSRWRRPPGSESSPHTARLGVRVPVAGAPEVPAPTARRLAMHEPAVPHLQGQDPEIAAWWRPRPAASTRRSG